MHDFEPIHELWVTVADWLKWHETGWTTPSSILT